MHNRRSLSQCVQDVFKQSELAINQGRIFTISRRKVRKDTFENKIIQFSNTRLKGFDLLDRPQANPSHPRIDGQMHPNRQLRFPSVQIR